MDKICCFNCFSKNGTVQEMLCEPCITENLKVPASSFCKSCEDPKPLCDICAKHHTKQKLSRNQVLCRERGTFLSNGYQRISNFILHNTFHNIILLAFYS